MSENKSVKEQIDEYRKTVADSFLHLLDIDNPVNSFEWIKGWQSMQMPYSITSSSPYRGVNKYHLLFTSIFNNWTDPRWITFSGLKKFPGARVNKGEHGTQIQRWLISDITKKRGEKGKYIDFPEMNRLIEKEGRSPDDFRAFPKLYYVFNACQCSGLPELINREKSEVDEDEYVVRAARNLQVSIMHDGNDSAYYMPADDSIHLPDKQAFFSSYEYNATALHELAHSTGAEKRLNRSLINGFGDDKYAFEELVAEMTSCMTASVLKPSEESLDHYITQHAENHYRYVKSWAQQIKDDPKCLESALDLAATATDYIDLAGGVLTLKEFHKRQKDYAVQLNEDGTIKATINKAALKELSPDIAPSAAESPKYKNTIEKGIRL